MLANLRAKIDPPTSIPVSIVSVATCFMTHSFRDLLLYRPRHRFLYRIRSYRTTRRENRMGFWYSGAIPIPEVTRCRHPLSGSISLKDVGTLSYTVRFGSAGADTRDEEGLSSFRYCHFKKMVDDA
jgi:hypothetical protein